MSNELFPNTTQIPKYSQMCQVVEDGSMTTLILSLYTGLAPQNEIDPKMCKSLQYQILPKSIRALGTKKTYKDLRAFLLLVQGMHNNVWHFDKICYKRKSTQMCRKTLIK
jgi:hypothetical protein